MGSAQAGLRWWDGKQVHKVLGDSGRDDLVVVVVVVVVVRQHQIKS
jgi:hypothetical protein